MIQTEQSLEVSILPKPECRKVVFIEQPGQKTGSRSPQVARAVPVKGRPISVDDIQKAKMHALFMQSKYHKICSSSNDDHQRKTEDPKKPPASWISNLPSASKTLVRLKIEDDSYSAVVASTISPCKLVDSIEPKSRLVHQESKQEKFRREQILWQTPPEMSINSLWMVATGDKSKEVEIQFGQIRWGKEAFYHSNQEIPPNPKEPWHLEIDYDDTLTPEIPTEQPPDADVAEPLASPFDKGKTSHNSAATAAATSKEYCPSSVSTSNLCAPELDLELVAVLLKNPLLVFALTSGQGGSLTSADTVRLLDMIKANGIGLPGISRRRWK
ncbi:hypothetical protein NE237_013528 [Protea cynaroides]|uniref:Uncharacterized protein n=1 Tax=Protea cynaroides TaxID=273540 RepID=A0A9Q0H038_9MAGN|nr:hypothetical protein NE237_013528 [Protea cynaroides]